MPKLWRVLRQRGFARLFAAATISQIGTSIHRIALLVLVYGLTGEALWVALVMIAYVVAGLVVTPALSAFADRYERRRLLVLADLARVPLVFAIPLFAIHSLPLLWGLVFCIEVMRGLHAAVSNAAIPELVSPNEVDSANGWILFTESISEVAFVGIAGLLVAAVGPQFAFWIDGVTFIVSAALLWGLPRLTPGHDAAEPYWQRVRAGVTYLFTQPRIRVVVFTLFAAAMFGTLQNALVVVLMMTVLQAGSAGFGFFEGMFALGTLAGTLLAPPLTERFPRGRVLIAGVLLFGLARASMGLLPVYGWVLTASLLSGIANMLFLIPVRSVLQLNTPAELRTRVFVSFSAVVNCAVLLGTFSGGMLAVPLGITMVFIVSGAAVCAVGLCAAMLGHGYNLTPHAETEIISPQPSAPL